MRAHMRTSCSWHHGNASNTPCFSEGVHLALSLTHPLPLCNISSFIFHRTSIKIKSKGLAVRVQNFPLSLHNCNHTWSRVGIFFFWAFRFFLVPLPPKLRLSRILRSTMREGQGKRRNHPPDWWGSWGNTWGIHAPIPNSPHPLLSPWSRTKRSL